MRYIGCRRPRGRMWEAEVSAKRFCLSWSNRRTTTTTVTSSSGWLGDPVEFVGRALRPRARLRERHVLGEASIEIQPVDETNTRIRPDRSPRDQGGRGAWSCSSACSRTNFLARSTSPGRCERRASRSRSAASMSRAAEHARRRRCRLERARAMGVSLFAGEAEGRLDKVLHDASGAGSSPSTISCRTCRASRARRSRSCRAARERTAGA